MEEDAFHLTTPYTGKEPIHRLLMTRLTQYQATNLKTIMSRSEPMGLNTFIDSFMKALNSVMLYRQKHVVDTRLGRLFDECDEDMDGLITFANLPLIEVLLGDDGSSDRSEVVVYNDTAAEVVLQMAPGLSYPDRSVEEKKEENRGHANKDKKESKDRRKGEDSAPTESRFPDIELSQCSQLEFHAPIKKYSMCHANDVLLMDLGDNNGTPTMEISSVLSGHQAPVLATLYVPHLKKLYTSSTDRTILVWSQEERFAMVERARMASALTCLTYDPLTQWLLGGGTDGYILLFNTVPKLSQAAFKRIQAHKGEWVLGIQFIPDIDVIASCGADSTVNFWDHVSMAKKSTKPATNSKGLQRIIYSRGHRALYTTSSSREVQIWSPFLAKATDTLREHEKPVVGVHCFNHSPELVTGDSSGKLCIWDMRKTSIVQTLGSPESVSPIGIISSFAYDSRRSAIVTLGGRINMFIPQKGSYSALMDIPVTSLSYCNITKKICVVSGNRILIFELTTGDLLHTHSCGSVEISCAVLTAQQDLLLGTFEGHIIATVVGTWQNSRTMHVGDSVKLMYDLGKQSRVGTAMEENPRALCVTSNGQYWHFCYGTTCEITGGPTVQYATGFESIHCCSFSAKNTLLYMSRKNSFEVWDISSNFRKSTQQLESWISSMTTVDPLGATMMATTKGEIFGFFTSTFTPVFKCQLKAGFAPTYLGFDRMRWVLVAGTQQLVVSIPIDEIVRQTTKHQRDYSKVLRSPKPMRHRFEVDTILDDAGSLPQVFTCRDNNSSNTLCCLIVCESSDASRCLQRLDHLKAIPDEDTKLPFVARVMDAFIPSLSERVFETNRHVYSVFEYFSVKRCAVDYFRTVLTDKTASPQLLHRIVSEVKWFIHCVATALNGLHEAGLVCLFRQRCIRLVSPEYKLFLDNGVWLEGENALDRLHPCDIPPEGVEEVAPSNDCWLLGLMVYEICCERTLFPANASPAHMEGIFSAVENAITLEALEETVHPSLNDPTLLQIVHRLLTVSATDRYTAQDVVAVLANSQIIPRHLTCLPVPNISDRKAMMTIPCEGLLLNRQRPVLPNATIAAVVVCEVPTLTIAGEFNGTSAHLVISNPEGKIVGITPPNNEVSVLWSVGREEVSSMRFAAEDVDVISPLKNSVAEGNGTDGKPKYNPAKYCPFFSEMREVQKTMSEEVLPPAYYLEGWHRLESIRSQPKKISSKQLERERQYRIETTKTYVANKKANDYLSDKYDPHSDDERDEKGKKPKSLPLASLVKKIKPDEMLLHRTMSPYYEDKPDRYARASTPGPWTRGSTKLPAFHRGKAFK